MKLGRPSAYGVTGAETAVFVSGVASMGLEIVAGRMVAPEFGSSIYTWGSIIGVFLAALSLGYYRGGKRAERASDGRLVRLLLGTAGYVAVLVFAGDLLLEAAAVVPLPARFASLPAVTLLFGPPTYLLGFISPYAAELSRKEAVGEASGHVYAVGTVGSIVGAFGATFVLVPTLSVGSSNFVFGALLVVAAVLVDAPSPSRETVAGALVVSAALLGAVGAGAIGYTVEGEVVYGVQTPYQELRVVDSGDTRTLLLDGARHSAIDTSNPDRHVFGYTRYFHLPFVMADDPGGIDDVLFIGGGGFTGPRIFADEYNVTVDAVEIDPEVIDVAERYFGVEESGKLSIYNDDGRRFLRQTDERYDLIVLDAYKKDKVPFHMTTVEFMRLAESRLSEDGMLFMNLISAPSGPASRFYRSEYRTVSRVFPSVYAFPTVGGGVVQNIEVVATKGDGRLTEETLRRRNGNRGIGYDLSGEIESLADAPPTQDVPVLRDDDAPVDSLLNPMVGQRYVIQETGAANATVGAG
ncbi:fused MFS/spermidine synthase [Haladaptatus sp. F3-133]|uniref:Polyamine aminopropyltransferase n=2 Tax=Halorutilus salinus TaxID=2487751 RepID=A0A9Q4C2Q7_9EURY|nr:fused MFS/spermidine synthase [Halorutilus salinus]